MDVSKYGAASDDGGNHRGTPGSPASNPPYDRFLCHEGFLGGVQRGQNYFQIGVPDLGGAAQGRAGQGARVLELQCQRQIVAGYCDSWWHRIVVRRIAGSRLLATHLVVTVAGCFRHHRPGRFGVVSSQGRCVSCECDATEEPTTREAVIGAHLPSAGSRVFSCRLRQRAFLPETQISPETHRGENAEMTRDQAHTPQACTCLRRPVPSERCRRSIVLVAGDWMLHNPGYRGMAQASATSPHGRRGMGANAGEPACRRERGYTIPQSWVRGDAVSGRHLPPNTPDHPRGTPLACAGLRAHVDCIAAAAVSLGPTTQLTQAPGEDGRSASRERGSQPKWSDLFPRQVHTPAQLLLHLRALSGFELQRGE